MESSDKKKNERILEGRGKEISPPSKENNIKKSNDDKFGNKFNGNRK